jgi:hypothetical protein
MASIEQRFHLPARRQRREMTDEPARHRMRVGSYCPGDILMNRTLCLSLAAGLLLCLALAASADDKGTEVKLDGLKSTTPASWKAEKPATSMRFAQFRVPRARGDEIDGELVIFKAFGGSAKQNVERWKGQFTPPEGKKLDDVARVEELTVAGCKVTYLDIEGTYTTMPTRPGDRPMKRPGFRMLAVQFEGPDNNYHILLRGPQKTIAEHKKGFDA